MGQKELMMVVPMVIVMVGNIDVGVVGEHTELRLLTLSFILLKILLRVISKLKSSN